jgi:hypothetical protein
MKVMLELDIPDGQDIPSTEDILRLTSPDWKADWWHIEDIQGENPDLTDEEAREVLGLMEKCSDPSIGISWDSINVWADWVRDESKDTK